MNDKIKEKIEPLGSWENIYIYKGNRSCGKSYIQSLLDDKDKEIERLTNIIEKAVEELELWQPKIETIKLEKEYLLDILNGRSDE